MRVELNKVLSVMESRSILGVNLNDDTRSARFGSQMAFLAVSRQTKNFNFPPKIFVLFCCLFFVFFGSCLFFISHFGFSSISVLTCTFFILDVSNESRTNWIFSRLRVYFFSLLSHVETCYVFILHRYICPDRKRNGKERNKMSINPMTRLT